MKVVTQQHVRLESKSRSRPDIPASDRLQSALIRRDDGRLVARATAPDGNVRLFLR